MSMVNFKMKALKTRLSVIICFIGVAPNDLYMRLEKISTINFHLLHPRGERGTGVGYK